MKILPILKFAVVTTAISLLFGCQKETIFSAELTDNASQTLSASHARAVLQTHQLKGVATEGYYSFVPDFGAGYVMPNPAPGWYPGTSTVGHLNILGPCQGFVNMYVTLGPNGLQGIAAPLNLFFADDLNDLDIVVPDAVAIIFFDKHGNSIWASANGTITITPVSATRVTFTSEATILGGTGKFVYPTGSFTFSGYFNPQDTNDVGVEVTNGTIVF